MKKVLIISYYWPPSGGSGVQRWLKFAKYLPQFGWEPIIYTPSNPQPNSIDEGLLKDISPNLKVIKRKIVEPYTFYKLLTGKDIKKPIKANIISNEGNSSFMHKLSLFIRGNCFIPDPRCMWIGPSARFLKKYLKENPVDAIVSTGPPHSMHLIAQKVSKATGTPWIADFRDPWTEIFYFKHLKLSRWAYRKHRRLEQGVLESADIVLVVTDQVRSDFATRTSKPVEVITNGFDPDDFVSSVSVLEPDNMLKFRVIHTGILTDSGNPDLLWEVLGEKAAADPEFRKYLEIRTMGQVDNSIVNDLKKNNILGNFTDMGYVAHNIATAWQQQAGLLILPIRKEPEAAAILPGKLFEYMAAGRPILAFGAEQSVLADALKECGCGSIADWDNKEAIKEAVESAYKLFLDDLMKRTSIDIGGDTTDLTGIERKFTAEDIKAKLSGKVLKYSRENLTNMLVGLLNRITKD